MKEEMELFNEEEVYDTQISPLMIQIIKICKEHKIPMIASFACENGEDKGVCTCTTLINNIDKRKVPGFNRASHIARGR